MVLKNIESGEVAEYTLVPALEADFKKNKISVISPLGKALLGKAIGENIKIHVPAGTLHYAIMKIKKD